MAVYLLIAQGLVAQGASQELTRAPPTGILLHNPALLSREELKRLFLVRAAELERVLDRLRGNQSASAHSILILGDPGLGKTTLLIRIAHAVEDDSELGGEWWPVRLEEEQYNVGSLADFWLNCLEKIAEDAGDEHFLKVIDDLVEKHQADEPLEEAAFLQLREYSSRKRRKFLILVDNFDTVLGRLDQDSETSRLREVLQGSDFLTLIGAASGPILESLDYESPFYEFFEPIVLEPLGEQESRDFLVSLGNYYDDGLSMQKLVEQRREMLKILHILIGGNLRSTVLLFAILQDQPKADLKTLIDRLFDRNTSFYKESIEGLSPQGQRIFDALARSWIPATAEEVALKVRTERGVASGQLHRLAERHLVTKVRLPQRSMGFQIRDRFFNLWYLMRAGRRERRLLHALLDLVGLLFRDGRPPDGFERLAARLERMELVAENEVEEARREAGKAEASEMSGQMSLFDDRLLSPGVRLLTLCRLKQREAAEKQARELLELDQETAFPRVVLAYLLEEKGQRREALEVIETFAEISPWMRLEQARLNIQAGRMERLPEILLPHELFDELPPRELAMTIAELARKGGDPAVWALQPLLAHLKDRAPDEIAVPLAVCQVELVFGRQEKALASYQDALGLGQELGHRTDSPEQRGFLLHMALQLAAAGLTRELSSLLSEAGLEKEWWPLTHALALRGDDPQRLERLSPEMQELTKLVIQRIEEFQTDSSQKS